MTLEKFLKTIADIIKSFLEHISKGKTLGSDYSRNKACLQFASGEIGVKEVSGSGNNAQVVKYHAYVREDNDLSKGQNDSVPWCASFMAYVLEANPYIKMGSTNSAMARSYLKWGISSKRKPLPGDIAVFWRNSVESWEGHVGFYLGETTSYIYLLSGNDSDMVRVAKHSKSKLLDIRRSSKAKEYSEVEEDQLYDMADTLIKGKIITESGKLH